ncbi:hypothetical protein [Actinacidiphila epipremni]|uniref:Uncharacterized protein n=1 Tax=Actinacidiphila epipremni TaxID=2053013 RepID=A0ABX0ZU24_9ACTN|nr:hypothetical protein [Actinacidiphila epipremni]NJP46472.1 hypothetical protein [Actinacidiphila epipremni]
MDDKKAPLYRLEFPEYLDGYEIETEAKGYLVEVRISVEGDVFDLVVYDPVRLQQEVVDEISENGYFAVANVLVVPKVTREEITRAVNILANSKFSGLGRRVIG